MSAGVDSVYHTAHSTGKRIEENSWPDSALDDRPPPEPASDGTTGVYGITTAAATGRDERAGPAALRTQRPPRPARTSGGTRRYSDTDIARLRRISVLIADGINLTGIARVLGLEADNAGLRTRNADLTTTNAALLANNTQLTVNNTANPSARRKRTG